MSQSNPTERLEPGSADSAAVRADIDRTRAQLADTVDQLTEKVNVKAQTSERVSAARVKVSDTAARAKASAPPQVQEALERAGEKVAPVAHKVSDQAAPHRGKIIAGVLATVGALAVARRRRAAGES